MLSPPQLVEDVFLRHSQLDKRRRALLRHGVGATNVTEHVVTVVAAAESLGQVTAVDSRVENPPRLIVVSHVARDEVARRERVRTSLANVINVAAKDEFVSAFCREQERDLFRGVTRPVNFPHDGDDRVDPDAARDQN